MKATLRFSFTKHYTLTTLTYRKFYCHSLWKNKVTRNNSPRENFVHYRFKGVREELAIYKWKI